MTAQSVTGYDQLYAMCGAALAALLLLAIGASRVIKAILIWRAPLIADDPVWDVEELKEPPLKEPPLTAVGYETRYAGVDENGRDIWIAEKPEDRDD